MRCLPRLIMLAALLACSVAHASPPLTTGDIDRWISTVMEFHDFAGGPADFLAEDPDHDNSLALDNLDSEIVRELQGSPQAMAVIRKQGFASAAQWLAIGQRINRAYAALDMPQADPQPHSEADLAAVRQRRQQLEQLFQHDGRAR